MIPRALLNLNLDFRICDTKYLRRLYNTVITELVADYQFLTHQDIIDNHLPYYNICGLCGKITIPYRGCCPSIRCYCRK
jgi:hypothetical protein